MKNTKINAVPSCNFALSKANSGQAGAVVFILAAAGFLQCKAICSPASAFAKVLAPLMVLYCRLMWRASFSLPEPAASK